MEAVAEHREKRTQWTDRGKRREGEDQAQTEEEQEETVDGIEEGGQGDVGDGKNGSKVRNVFRAK